MSLSDPPLRKCKIKWLWPFNAEYEQKQIKRGGICTGENAKNQKRYVYIETIWNTLFLCKNHRLRKRICSRPWWCLTDIVASTDFLAACRCRLLLHLKPVQSAPVGLCSNAELPPSFEPRNCSPAMYMIGNRPSAGASTTFKSLRLIRTFSVPFCRWSYTTSSSAEAAAAVAAATDESTAAAMATVTATDNTVNDAQKPSLGPMVRAGGRTGVWRGWLADGRWRPDRRTNGHRRTELSQMDWAGCTARNGTRPPSATGRSVAAAAAAISACSRRARQRRRPEEGGHGSSRNRSTIVMYNVIVGSGHWRTRNHIQAVTNRTVIIKMKKNQ